MSLLSRVTSAFQGVGADIKAIYAALDLKATAADPTTTGTLTHSGDLVFSGLAKRIIGDFSNATFANRTILQTSTVNSTTSVTVVPNGTSANANFQGFNNSDPTNASVAQFGCSVAETQVISTKVGTGSFLPMAFYTNGVERMRIDTAGLVGIGGTPLTQLHIVASNPGTPATSGTATTGVSFRAQSSSVNFDFGTYGSGVCFIQPRLIGNNAANFGLSLCPNGGGVFMLQSNGGAFTAGEWSRNANWGTYYKAPTTGTTADIALVSANGSIGWTVSDTGVGFPSGIGAGGTVTQATSKGTTVTLNKATGQITMHNAALAAGAEVQFGVTNSLASVNDCVIVGQNNTAINTNAYQIRWVASGPGAFYVGVKNLTAGSLSDALVINFVVIKGATT